MMRAEEKIAWARKVKETLTPLFKVRRGKAYVFAQCKRCLKLFEISYKYELRLFTLENIRKHIDWCRARSLGLMGDPESLTGR